MNPLPLFNLEPAAVPEHPDLYDRDGTRWTWHHGHGGYFSEYNRQPSAGHQYPLDALERDCGPLSQTPVRRRPCAFCGGRR